MSDIAVSDTWHDTFLGGHVGVLLMEGIDNTVPNAALDARKRALEEKLRAQFAHLSRQNLLELDVLRAYRAYYKRFDQTYHVQLQLESVVYKGKSLPDVSPLVDASFVAELDTLVLTASHDADRLVWPLRIDATRGGEVFEAMNGKVRTLRANDMMMADAQGPVCTILYGQDRRTPVTAATTRALFVCYAPAGVGEARVRSQLLAIEDNVRLFAPQAETRRLDISEAGIRE
ncbi:phenylalanine--tRNA ligase beta subunit-related protein [Deinococcus planocerae]|uniref:phenylalanine--tRNA ligase beta subunit-related protein n=1 Tax=Deinococcus planocerae TaxID=1737569 RepID=UPI000C7F4C8A|nr:phenylalanine--tRNA ligase beta subunit-related protein [Deinococcus planocerae]